MDGVTACAPPPAPGEVHGDAVGKPQQHEHEQAKAGHLVQRVEFVGQRPVAELLHHDASHEHPQHEQGRQPVQQDRQTREDARGTGLLAGPEIGDLGAGQGQCHAAASWVWATSRAWAMKLSTAWRSSAA